MAYTCLFLPAYPSLQSSVTTVSSNTIWAETKNCGVYIDPENKSIAYGRM